MAPSSNFTIAIFIILIYFKFTFAEIDKEHSASYQPWEPHDEHEKHQFLLNSTDHDKHDGLPIIDLQAWFNETYIKKLTGAYDMKKKGFSAVNYNPAWEMFHFHHVCVRGGTDGLYVGIQNIENDWKPRMKSDYQVMSQVEYNELMRIRGNMPIFAKKMEPKYLPTKVHFFRNNTLFTNCYRQRARTSNPAHWLMKLGLIYELALCFSRNAPMNIFKDTIDLPFVQLYMHQCPDPYISDWKWGLNVLNIVRRRMNESHVFTDGMTVTQGYEIPGEADFRSYTCFDDLYIGTRMVK